MQSSTHFVSIHSAAFRSQTNGSRPPLGKAQQLFSAKSWWTISRAFCLRLPVPTVTSIARLASYEPKHLSSMFPVPLAFLKPAPCLPPVCVANNMMRKGLPPSSSPSLGWSRNSGLMSFSACDSSFCPSTVHRIRCRPLAITVWSKVPGLKGSAKKKGRLGLRKIVLFCPGSSYNRFSGISIEASKAWKKTRGPGTNGASNLSSQQVSKQVSESSWEYQSFSDTRNIPKSPETLQTFKTLQTRNLESLNIKNGASLFHHTFGFKKVAGVIGLGKP